MIRCAVSFILGAWFGIVMLCVIQAGRDPGGPWEVADIQTDESTRGRKGFEPLPGFNKDCAAVCGNCVFWDTEVFAWGQCRVCRLSYQSKDEGDMCNIRDGEVIR